MIVYFMNANIIISVIMKKIFYTILFIYIIIQVFCIWNYML